MTRQVISDTLLDKINENFLDLYGRSVSVVDYGADPSGVLDSSAAFQAMNDALGYIAVPDGTFKIASTVSCTGNVVGAGLNRSVIVPAITDGSAVFQWAAKSFFLAQGLKIEAEGGYTAFFNGTGGPCQNCIGLKVFKSGGYPTRYAIRDVFVKGCSTGIHLDEGFIANLDNVLIQYCVLGLYGYAVNASDLNLRIEICRKSFEINASSGVHLRSLLDEGDNAGSIASTLDGCNGVTMSSPYWEWGTNQRTEPYLKIGATTLCKGIDITGAQITGANGLAAGVYPIEADKVEGFRISGNAQTGSQRLVIKTTANTLNYEPRLMVSSSGAVGELLPITDDSKQMGPASNYFPNSNFDLWLRGWNSLAKIRCAFSRETSIVRKGENALRITATAGQSSNYVQFESAVSPKWVTSLRGKVIRLGAWIWVPDDAAYSDSARTAYPSIIVQSYNGTATVSGASGNSTLRRNAWNWISARVTVQTDATRIYVNLYQNQSSTLQAGAEYIVVDSVSLCENTVPEWRQMDGVQDSSLIDAIGIGGRMIERRASVPNSSLMVYEVGDQVLFTVPTTHIGSVCTVAGSPGTWSAFGAV